MAEHERAHLVERASDGDADALQQLIVCYHQPLYGYLVQRIGEQLRGRIDPDDVLQETYIAAFKAVEECSFASSAAFYRWLETIASNILKNHQRALRTGKRDVAREIGRQASVTGSFADLVCRMASPDSTPSRQVRKAEASGAVLSCLARLSDEQRDAVKMRFLEGKPIPEIASHLSRTDAAVYMLLHRGLKTLRELLVSMSHYLTRT